MEMPGYAYCDPSNKFKNYIKKRYAELIEDNTISVKVTDRDYQYRKNCYKGIYTGDITETDIAMLVNGGGVPFGGRVYIHSDNKFTCYIYTE